MVRKLTHCLIPCIVVLTLSGCVRETTEGETRVFTYETWVPASVLLGGMAAGVAGWFLRSVTNRLGWGLLIAGPILAILFGPSLFMDRASIDSKSLSIRTGIWGMTATHEVNLDKLKQVRLVSEEKTGRRGRKRTEYFMLCELTDGTSAKVPVNNSISEAVAPHFLDLVASRNLPIVDDIKEQVQ
jgi:hypothetical protein